MKATQEIIEFYRTSVDVLRSSGITKNNEAYSLGCLERVKAAEGEVDLAEAARAFRAAIEEVCIQFGMEPGGTPLLFLRRMLNPLTTNTDWTFINEVSELVVEEGIGHGTKPIDFLRLKFKELRKLTEKFEELQCAYANREADTERDPTPDDAVRFFNDTNYDDDDRKIADRIRSSHRYDTNEVIARQDYADVPEELPVAEAFDVDGFSDELRKTKKAARRAGQYAVSAAILSGATLVVVAMAAAFLMHIFA